MQLTLIEKPSGEIISLEEAKNYLRIDHDFDDDLLSMMIKSTREAMESIIQKSIMFQTWRYTIYKHSVCNFAPKDNDIAYMHNRSLLIPLPKPPIMKIIKVKAGVTELAKEDYKLRILNSRFCALISYKNISAGEQKFPTEITYEAGISDDVENIPYQLKLANLIMLKNAYQERYSYNVNCIISREVKQLLTQFMDLRIF
jgi:hypothetical protein